MKKYLLFIGDSLTEWFDWDRRFPAYAVENLGISGETVEEMIDRRDHIRAQASVPNCVFLMTGINNVLQGRSDFMGTYAELVRSFATWWKGASIVVQSLLPVDYSWIGNDTIKELNRQLASIAKEQGADYLDIYAAFVDREGRPKVGYLSDDGVHLASKGYEAWAKIIEKYLTIPQDVPRN